MILLICRKVFGFDVFTFFNFGVLDCEVCQLLLFGPFPLSKASDPVSFKAMEVNQSAGWIFHLPYLIHAHSFSFFLIAHFLIGGYLVFRGVHRRALPRPHPLRVPLLILLLLLLSFSSSFSLLLLGCFYSALLVRSHNFQKILFVGIWIHLSLSDFRCTPAAVLRHLIGFGILKCPSF